MNRGSVPKTFLLKVGQQQSQRRFVLRDLRSGKRLEFGSWKALERYAEQAVQGGLH